MSDALAPVWETYTASWKAATAQEKEALYARSLAPDCVCTDPVTQIRGWNELVAHMLDFHTQTPGGHFRTIWFQAHHRRSVSRWNMVDGSGTVLGEGVSYGEYDDADRLVATTVFYELPT